MNQPVRSPAQQSQASQAFDTNLFLRDHRIHMSDGSVIVPTSLLMVHPDEVKPENQQRFFAKLVKHHSLPYPNFYEAFPRNLVAFSLAGMLPASQDARVETLKKAVSELQEQAQTGLHPQDQKQAGRYSQPLHAFGQLLRDKPDLDATQHEYLQNGIALYLVVAEALHASGRDQELSSYVRHLNSPDSIIADLAGKFGKNANELVQAIQQNGVKGLAETLGVSTAALQEIQQVAALSASLDYSFNVVQNWQVGRRIAGMETASVEQKIAVGVLYQSALGQQILTQQLHGKTLPEDIIKDQQEALATLAELPPVLQEALYVSGTEFAFTQHRGLGHLSPSMRGVLGVHMHIPFQRGGDDGLRQIRVSNMESVSDFRRTMHHEASHFFVPKVFGDETLKQIDGMMQTGASRLREMKAHFDDWKRSQNPQVKAAILDQIDQQFQVGEFSLKGLLNKGHSVDSIRGWVDHALQNLDPHSHKLSRGYPAPELRAAEIISRYSELEFVALADKPELLAFIAPELMVVYHDHYLPHLAEHVQELKQQQEQLPETLRYMGLPPEARVLMTQHQAMQAPLPGAQVSPRPRPRPQSAEATAEAAPAAASSAHQETPATQLQPHAAALQGRLAPSQGISQAPA